MTIEPIIETNDSKQKPRYNKLIQGKYSDVNCRAITFLKVKIRELNLTQRGLSETLSRETGMNWSESYIKLYLLGYFDMSPRRKIALSQFFKVDSMIIFGGENETK